MKSDIPAEGLKAGEVWKVAHVYRDGLTYEVEFAMLAGDTAGKVTVEGPQVRAVRHRESCQKPPDFALPFDGSVGIIP